MIPFDSDELAKEEENMKKAEAFVKYIHIHRYRMWTRAFVFCPDSEYMQVKLALDWFHSLTEEKEFDWDVQLFKLSHLHHYYSLEVRNGLTYPQSLSEVNTTSYVYYGLCDFHFRLDNNHCARGNAVNSSFILTHAFCPAYNIEMISDRHTTDG